MSKILKGFVLKFSELIPIVNICDLNELKWSEWILNSTLHQLRSNTKKCKNFKAGSLNLPWWISKLYWESLCHSYHSSIYEKLFWKLSFIHHFPMITLHNSEYICDAWIFSCTILFLDLLTLKDEMSSMYLVDMFESAGS